MAGDEKLLTKLLGGKHIQRLPETYLVPLLGIKKLELLDTDEAYIVETVENLLQSAGVVADRHKLENNLVQNYVAQEAQVNLDTEVNNYDLTMEMLFNLRFAEDSGLFLEEVVPEVQEVETEASGEQLAKEAKEKEAQAKAEEEKKKLEEDYKTTKIDTAGIAGEKLKLGGDEYFVLGDNRKNSEDSRSADIGKVKRSYIYGKAWFVASPKKDWGFVK